MIKVIQMDIQDDKSIQRANDEISEVLQGAPLNLLVNNAGHDLIVSTY